MLVLFGQGTPLPIRPFLKEHRVQTTAERGWDTRENGELLKAAEAAGFDVLVTPDMNMRYQQNLTVRTIALVAPGNPRRPVVNGYDFEVRRPAACEFMMHSIARGKFRF